VIILFITKRSEERRHLRELAMKGAIENWQYVSKSAEDAREPRLPLDVYMVHMFKLAEVLSSGKLTAENLPAKLRDAQKLTRVAIAEAVRYSQERGDDGQK
jgi:hypothetical protein